MPKFNVQFFKPYVRNAPGVCFADVLTIIAGLNNVQRIRTGDDPAVILGIQIQGSEFLGEAARIRMDDLPSVIDVASGNRHDLDVSEHEGLGEEIYFLYDSVIDVIAIQNRAHFRPSALALLLGQLSTRAIEFEIIFNSTAWNRFDRMGLVKKIDFKLARPRDLGDRPQPAVNRVFEEIDEFNGIAAKIEITAGRERGRTLNIAAIRRFLQSFRGMEDNFESLSITGAMRAADNADAPMHAETIDFVQERLGYLEEVERRGRGRRLDADGCRVALRRGIREHIAYLRRYQ